MNGSVMMADLNGVEIINESDLDVDLVMAELRKTPEIDALVRWSRDVQGQGRGRREGNLFERDRYVLPQNWFAEIETAKYAQENDDVVASVLESTEALAFSRMAIECDDDDEEDIWNQIAEDIDMDSRLREIWRECFILGQCYVGVWWGRKSYKVRGKSKQGITRKKTFDNIRVPLGMTILDPRKVMPVGNFLFNQEDLVYIADRTEQDAIDTALGYGEANSTIPVVPDQVVSQMLLQKWSPGPRDRKQLADLGVDIEALYLMNPDCVFRHTNTRSQYERFASVRLKSLFEVLDIKHQLRQMDRATLVGGTNFIILIKKGSDQYPATQTEVDNLKSQVQTVARLPVLVGDHRLSVEIVTPKQDHTLEDSRYFVIDGRIANRLYGMLVPAHAGGRSGDDSIKLARVIARGLESRRHMIRRSLEKNLLRACYEKNDQFTERPSLRFYPKRIALDFDPALANFLLDLWTNGALSRESVLSEVDYSQADEAHKKQAEKDRYDKIFEPAVLPPGTGPNPAAGPAGKQAQQRSAGRTQGGNKNGGGAAPGTGQGQPPVRPNKTSPGSQDGRKQQAKASIESATVDPDVWARFVEWAEDNDIDLEEDDQ